ncbi:TetR/AcrR family transcriptional regulator [Tistrella bauzanensis]|uniref:TetR/AcrR family transcriptional regulator n=1 Tax=Tistrella arctica TaxID=3133430 RepID=A0ABU9YE71_9PROT
MSLRTDHDETRARIADVAEELFRRLGYAKTTVADIASELGMSPANVYRFFPSKSAIVQNICCRFLDEVRERCDAIAGRPEPASVRIEAMVLDILGYHRRIVLREQRIHDVVLVGIRENWDAIMAHKEDIRAIMARILADGAANGEFPGLDADDAATALMNAGNRFCHPVMIADGLDDDLDTEARRMLRYMFAGFRAGVGAFSPPSTSPHPQNA